MPGATPRVDFAGVDLLDGTPVLDLKPWAAPLDVPGYARHHPDDLGSLRYGWYDTHRVFDE